MTLFLQHAVPFLKKVLTKTANIDGTIVRKKLNDLEKVEEIYKEALLQMVNPDLRKGQTVMEIYNSIEPESGQFNNVFRYSLLYDFRELADGKSWCETANLEMNLSAIFKAFQKNKVFISHSAIQESKCST